MTRQLQGYTNRMPGPGSSEGRSYVILGGIAEWTVAPVSITIHSNSYTVNSEGENFIARGISSNVESTVQAVVSLEDETSENVEVKFDVVH